MTAKSKIALFLLAVFVVFAVSVLHAEERRRIGEELRFEEIKKQFPHSDLAPMKGAPVNVVLPRLDFIKEIKVNVFQHDKKDTWQQFSVEKKDFARFYSFMAYSVPVINESELNIIVFLKIQTLKDGTFDGLVLTGGGPVLYAFRNPDRHENWFHFATMRTGAEVVGFLNSLQDDKKTPK